MWYISSSESESRSESSSEANGRTYFVGATNDAMCGARCSIRRPLCSAGGPMTCLRTMISIETGAVKLIVRLVGFAEKRHGCLTGPILFHKPRPSHARASCGWEKTWQSCRGLASSKTLGTALAARQTTLQAHEGFSRQRLRHPSRAAPQRARVDLASGASASAQRQRV